MYIFCFTREPVQIEVHTLHVVTIRHDMSATEFLHWKEKNTRTDGLLSYPHLLCVLPTSLAYLNRFLQKLDPPRQNFTINRRILLKSNENIAIKRSRKYTIIFVGFPI